MSEELSESPLSLEFRENIIKILSSFSARDRLVNIDAALTELSRHLFHRSCVTNSLEAHQKLISLKRCYLALANETFDFLYHRQPLKESDVLPPQYLEGLLSFTQKITTQREFLTLWRFAAKERSPIQEMIEIYPFLGILGNLGKYVDEKEAKSNKEYFRESTWEALELVKRFYSKGKFSFFFGNVSNGNFDASLLVNICCPPPEEDQLKRFRLYQYSRKAGELFGEEYGKFRTLDLEFAGIDKNSGICLVDGTCMSGESIEKSITGFQEKGFKGPLYIFISHGFYPRTKFKFVQLYPDPDKEPFIPGEIAKGSMFLKLRES